MTELDASQLMALMQNAPALDNIAAPLSQDKQAQLLDLQRRAGDAYAAGEWQGEGGKVIVPPRSKPPTVEEAQKILGAAYMELEDKKDGLRAIMDAMGLNPSARRPAARQSWVDQVIENVTGWFR